MDNEHLIMPFIDSCNIACGGHAGDPTTMKRVISLARENGVEIGAHPSYPDKENFGRVSLNMEQNALTDSIRSQMHAFTEALGAHHRDLHHIKAHGALYNDLAKDRELAEVFLKGISAFREEAVLYVPFDSEIGKVAVEQGFKIAVEAFGDRNYRDDLRLVSRKEPGALITDKGEVLAHVHRISRGYVRTISGNEYPLHADTICIHSDTDNALDILKYLKQHLN